MTTPRDLVESFYEDVWNRRDVDAARRIIAPDFRFRGSLGPEKRGVDGFVTYLDAIHTALGGFTCIIEDLVEAPERAAARMLFKGVHQAELFGAPATGKMIEWSGAAFFTIRQQKIAELWVLGDVDAVKRQLGPATSLEF
ncbi:ester cyclase [Hoeflea sp. WL0058]|uniref:Ester cyclase n=1 Tax=Flavimaribacter sediminis TaxID=2865987 RepID=A0AAE3CY62_9HYPH|nr:ester cyclase [Flavimaribacter sediminis]MBW8635825.1 ester cyclase [Flavimaribacter sediminis]